LIDSFALSGHRSHRKLAAIIALALCAAGSARADEVDEAAAAAREAFKRGTELAKSGQWSDALAEFQRSSELRPHAVTTYNLAYCQRALGHYTLARKLFALALSDHKGRGAVELPEDLITSADDYLAELDRKVARVTITLAPPDAAVSVDGAPLEPLASDVGHPLLLAGTRAPGPPEAIGAARFEVLVDPGMHKFAAARVDHRDTLAERTLASGDRVDLPLEASRIVAADATPSDARPNRVPALIAFGVGSLGLATFAVAGIVALGKRSQLDDVCPGGQCYQGQGNDTLDGARTAANVATVGLVVGVAGGATGVALWWLASPRAAARPASAPVLSPHVGFGSVGLAGRF
jgi:hypothetical protein